MKLPMTKKHVTKNSWMPRLRNAILCTALLVPLSFYYGCSSDNDDSDKGGEVVNPPTDNGKTHSVRIADNNANLPSGGTITSQYSDSPGGCDVSRIVDNDASTCYSTSHSNFYISWDGSKTATITYYALVSAADTPEKDPKSWNLFASNDNKNWTALDRQKDQTFSKRGEKKEFYIENKTAYKYFKLEVLSNNGNASTQIAELYILKKDAPEELNPEDPYTVTVDAKNLNMPSGGKITSQYSDFPLGSDIGKLVDYNKDTQFTTPHSEFYIMWEGYKSSIINFYSLTSAKENPESAPKSWKLYGTSTVSPDPKNPDNWTLIDEQKDQVFTAAEEKNYQIENTEKFKYYKLDVLSNNGGESTQIAEWIVQGFATDFDDLMDKSTGDTHSSSTSMGKRFEGRHVTTNADKTWLNDVSKDAEIPAISGLSWKEYNVTLYPFGEPVPADINQRGIGDCSALAIFASMAYIYPDFVKSLIKDNGNKTYTVNMFDPQGKPVTVTVNSTFLSGSVIGKQDMANWGTVLEKAIMKWQYIYKVNPDINGIGSEHVAPLFTGNGDSFAFSDNKLTGLELAQVAQVCITQGKITVGGFTTSGIPVDGTETVSGHAWTIMHSTDKTALFTMRNPWGGNPKNAPASRDGVINIPDNASIPKLIDFRIIEPGIAANHGKGRFTPYIPPVFPSAGNELRIEHWIKMAAK